MRGSGTKVRAPTTRRRPATMSFYPCMVRRRASVVLAARLAQIIFGLRRLKQIAAGAVATDDERLVRRRVRVLPRDDRDDVHPRAERQVGLERHVLGVRAVAVRVVEYLARADEDV